MLTYFSSLRSPSRGQKGQLALARSHFVHQARGSLFDLSNKLFNIPAMTRQAYNYAAQMRSNIALIRKSPRATARQYIQSIQQSAHYLEQKVLIYPPVMEELGLTPEMTYLQKKEELSVESMAFEPTPEQKEFNEFMQQSAAKKRKSHWLWRVGAATVDLQMQGWYPFFVTLTVDQAKYDARKLWQDGDAWRQYKRQISLIVTRALGHKPAHKSGVPDSHYFRYFGVLEHGKSRTHDHMHVLLWMRAIPDSWKRCPNRRHSRQEDCNANRCLPLETYWPWSNPFNRPALYFRSENDIWSKHGFRLPNKKKTEKPIRLNPPEKAGLYLAKYMGKDEKEWNHRVKATHNLGLELLKDRINRLSLARVEALTWRPETESLSISVQRIHSVPSGLIRSIAKLNLWSRKYALNQLNSSEELKKNSDVYKQMLVSVNDGARPSKMASEQFYAWVTEHLPVQPGYCDKKLLNSHRGLRYLFPETFHKEIRHIGASN